MKYKIGKVYLFRIFIDEDDEVIQNFIKIVDAYEYRDGYKSTSFKYKVASCEADGNGVSSETYEWTEKGLSVNINAANRNSIIEYYEDKIENFKSIIKKLKDSENT